MTKRLNNYLCQEGGFYPQMAGSRCEAPFGSVRMTAIVCRSAGYSALAWLLNVFDYPPLKRA
jgi:hypothetical protein